MTELYWPTSGVAMPQSQWGQVLHAMESAGVIGSPGDATLEAYFTPGVGLFVRTGSAVLAGLYTNDAVKTITVPVNSGGSARLDLLTLRQNMASPSSAVLTYVTGGASEPAPQYDPAGITDVPIAGTSVPAGTAIPSVVTDRRRFSPADVVPCRVAADIPTTRRRFGTIAVELPGRPRVWNGTAWDTLVTQSTYVGQRFYTTQRTPLGGFDQFASGSFVSLMAGTLAYRAGDWAMHVEATLAAVGAAATIGNLRVMWNGLNLSQDARCDLISTLQHYSFRYFFTTSTLPGSTAWSVAHQTATTDGLIYNTGSSVTFEYLGPRS